VLEGLYEEQKRLGFSRILVEMTVDSEFPSRLR
jgi:hypothetical protein